MVDGTRRRLLLSLPALALNGRSSSAWARPETLRFATRERTFDVLSFRASGPGPKPAVLVMGGSKGYASANYALLAAALGRLGIDTCLVGYLSEDDGITLERAGSVQARLADHARRNADWAATIPATIEGLRRTSGAPTRFGVLGLSLGAMPALTAGAQGHDIGALAIIDGSLPDDALTAIRTLPPLLAFWGGADAVFPVGTGAKKLDALARRLGGPSRLVTYPGQGHAFFVEAGNPAAARARAAAADFFAAHL